MGFGAGCIPGLLVGHVWMIASGWIKKIGNMQDNQDVGFCCLLYGGSYRWIKRASSAFLELFELDASLKVKCDQTLGPHSRSCCSIRSHKQCVSPIYWRFFVLPCANQRQYIAGRSNPLSLNIFTLLLRCKFSNILLPPYQDALTFNP